MEAVISSRITRGKEIEAARKGVFWRQLLQVSLEPKQGCKVVEGLRHSHRLYQTVGRGRQLAG